MGNNKKIAKAAEKYALDCQNSEGCASPTYDSYDAMEMRECAFMRGAEWMQKCMLNTINKRYKIEKNTKKDIIHNK